MRPLIFILTLALAGCSTPPPPAPVQAEAEPAPLVPPYPSAEEVAVQAPPAKSAPTASWTAISDFNGQPLVGGASVIEYKIGRERHSFKVQVVVFDDRQFDLKVIDQPEDWSGGNRLTDCMRAAAAVAGVNGGFFTPEFKPMGLMIASGKRLSDIAEELTLSPKTVSVYRARVLEKLGLQNNAELTVYAIRNGLTGN